MGSATFKRATFEFILRETNLKARQALPETAELQDDHVKISKFNGNLIDLTIILENLW